MKNLNSTVVTTEGTAKLKELCLNSYLNSTVVTTEA